MKLDAIVAVLLGSPYVQKKLGPGRTSELADASPELPALLRELGDTAFVEAADRASDLLEISRLSLGDFDDVEEEVKTANTARQGFYEACTRILATIEL